MNKTYPYTIDNGNGELITFTGRTQGPAGERVAVDGVAQPGAGPPMHVHYLQEEAVQVVRGRVGYQVLFASTKENGGKRPGLFDAAFLVTRYRTEFALLELPAFVRGVVMPIVYRLGVVLRKYQKFKDAPAPMQRQP
jgi:hypothetical protein